MERISQVGSFLKRTSIREIVEMQIKLSDEFDDIISFTIGEPDFPTPPNIVDACIKALEEGKTKYAPNAGIRELKKAISNKVKQTHGMDYDSEKEILVTVSGMDTLRLAALALLDIDEEMIVNEPYWSNHPNHAGMAHAKTVLVPVYEKNNFMYDPDDLEKYVTPKTKLILLNSPSNPTGTVISHEALTAFCDFCKKHDLIVISDEVYHNIIFDGLKFYSPAMIEGMRDRTVIINSFSKTYAMTGWRLGFAAAPNDIIEAMGRLNENSVSCVNTFVQYAGIEALNGPSTYTDAMVAEFQRRRDRIYTGINMIEKLSCIKPQGAFYAFVNIQKTGLSSQEFSIRLLNEKHVGTVPGSGFGAAGEGFVRLSFATSYENIEEGIARIADFTNNLG